MTDFFRNAAHARARAASAITSPRKTSAGASSAFRPPLRHRLTLCRVSFRPVVQILRQRIEVLHRELLASGGAAPPMTADDADAANKALETLGLPELPRHGTARLMEADPSSELLLHPSRSDNPETSILDSHSQEQPAAPSDTAFGINGSLDQSWCDAAFTDDLYPMNMDDSTVSPDWPWMALFTSDQDLLPMTVVPDPAPAAHTSQPANQSAGSGEDDEVDEELVGQIAARFGSLHVAPDGKLRYFGTPANLHLFNGGKGPYSSPHATKVDAEQLLRNADLETDIPPDIEQHLLELYFAWHNACNPVVDESMFWALHEQAGNQPDSSGYYSDVLRYAMHDRPHPSSWMLLTASPRCAIGASFEGRYHPRLVTYPRPLADFFAQRAKILLELQLDSPSVSTIQALLLLSSHELGFQRTARAWLYGGACQKRPSGMDTNEFESQAWLCGFVSTWACTSVPTSTLSMASSPRVSLGHDKSFSGLHTL